MLRELFAAGGTEGTKLVFVSACFSLRSAQAFVDAGVPHVVAVDVNTRLRDRAALSFTRAFYLALIAGAPAASSTRPLPMRMRTKVGTREVQDGGGGGLNEAPQRARELTPVPAIAGKTVRQCVDIGRAAVVSMPDLPAEAARLEAGKFVLLPAGSDHSATLFADAPEGRLVNISAPPTPNNLPAVRACRREHREGGGGISRRVDGPTLAPSLTPGRLVPALLRHPLPSLPHRAVQVPDHFRGRNIVLFGVVSSLLQDRLVTVVGPFGRGKSALAIAARYALSSPAAVGPCLALTLSPTPTPPVPPDRQSLPVRPTALRRRGVRAAAPVGRWRVRVVARGARAVPRIVRRGPGSRAPPAQVHAGASGAGQLRTRARHRAWTLPSLPHPRPGGAPTHEGSLPERRCPPTPCMPAAHATMRTAPRFSSPRRSAWVTAYRSRSGFTTCHPWRRWRPRAFSSPARPA